MAWLRSDDIDGSTDDVQPVDVGYKGQVYVLHLGPANRAALDADIAPWLKGIEPRRPMGIITDHTPSRPTPRTSGRTGPKKAPPSRPNMTEIRQWAVDNNYTLKPLGRIPKHILEAYDAVH